MAESEPLHEQPEEQVGCVDGEYDTVLCEMHGSQQRLAQIQWDEEKYQDIELAVRRAVEHYRQWRRRKKYVILGKDRVAGPERGIEEERDGGLPRYEKYRGVRVAKRGDKKHAMQQRERIERAIDCLPFLKSKYGLVS
jgi:hypothetical protein